MFAIFHARKQKNAGRDRMLVGVSFYQHITNRRFWTLKLMEERGTGDSVQITLLAVVNV